MIKLFIGILFLFLKVKTQDFTAEELSDVSRVGFSVKQYSVDIFEYSLKGNLPLAPETCLRTTTQNITECLAGCIGTFQLFCGRTMAEFGENICLGESGGAVDMTIVSTNPACFDGTPKVLVVKSSTGSIVRRFPIVDIFPNEVSDVLESVDGESSIKYSVKKLCHPLMGERCTTACIAPSSRHRCDFKTGKLLCRGSFSGPNCDIGHGPCANNPCINGGQCTDGIDGNPICLCQRGKYGRFCEKLKCNFKTCLNGMCNNLGVCNCNQGFTGPTCDEAVCTNSSCSNGGVCRKIGRAITCDCNTRLSVGLKCEKACSTNCGLNGVCVATRNDGVCLCPFGFTGSNCLTQLRIIECFDNICSAHGDCQSIEGSNRFCKCLPGWRGKSCSIPVCDKSTCFGGLCLNGEKCICKKTFSGETCKSRICNDPGFCKNDGVCVETADSIRCDCPSNFVGDQCQHRCLHDCSENGLCVIRSGMAVCECKPGFSGDSCRDSAETGACQRLGCKHNSQCALIDGEYRCICTSGWEGRDCSISKCHSIPCIFGSCLSGHGCVCARGITGSNCSIVACSDDFCNFRGTCSVVDNRRRCDCNTPFYGRVCEYACNPACVHGRCQYEMGFSRCVCDPNFSGPTCEIESKLEAQLNLELSLVVIFAIIAIITFLICLVSRVAFKKQSHEKLFVQGTIQEAFTMKKKPEDDMNLQWNNLL